MAERASEQRPPARELARRGLVTTTTAAAVVIVLMILWKASAIFLTIFAAILFAIFLRSISHWIHQKTPLGERSALAVTALLFIGAAVLATIFVAPSVSEQFDELSRTLPRSIERLEETLGQYGWAEWTLEQLRRGGEAMEPAETARRAGAFLGVVAGGVTFILLTIFAGFYIALSPHVYRGALIRLVPPESRRRADEVLVAVESTLRWWLLGRFVSMIAIGVLTWIGLLLLDVPLALVLGVIAGLLSFVPFVGPVLSAIPAVLLALTIDPSKAWHVIILYSVIQMIESYLITPVVEKKAVWLPPALTVAVEVLGGVLLGALGVIFATPLTAVAIVLVKMLYVQDLFGEEVEVSRAD
jgi:predicted PurR-regulated permease PerM